MIQEPEDPYLERARAALAEPEEEDPYLARARAVLEDEGPGFSDYAKLPVRGAMEAVAGPLRGVSGMFGAARRALPILGVIPTLRRAEAYTGVAGEAIRGLEPEIHPGAEQSTLGRTLEGAGQVGATLAGTLLLPASAPVQLLGAGGAMGAQSFGAAQERALAEGATPQQADLAGAANFPAGFVQAIPIGRAATVLKRAEGILSKGVLAAGAKEGALNAGIGAGANAYSEAIAQSIHGEADLNAIMEAVKIGVVPDAIIGFLLGGGARWQAGRRGPVTPQAGAEIDAAAQAAADAIVAQRAAQPPGEAGTPQAPDAGPDVGPSGTPALETPTRIEEPDEPTTGAVGRYRKALKSERDFEVHEAPQELADRAAAIGARLVEVDAGEALQAPAFYDAETATILMDRRADPEQRRDALLDHEITHHAQSTAPKLAAEWRSALNEVAPKWFAETARKRRQRHKDEGLPRLSVEGSLREADAEAAEGLRTVLDLVDQVPNLVAQVAEYKPGLFRSLADLSIDFANKIGLTKRSSVAKKVTALQDALNKQGTDFEKTIGAQAASQLAIKLRDLHRAMRVETPIEQPKAKLRDYDEAIGPQPAYDEPVGPQPRSAEQLASRKALKKGMPPDDAATALEVIDTRIEDALTAGESPDSPRMGELKKDRAAAVRILYEGDPSHPILSRESPVDLWQRIVAEDERMTKERRAQQEKDGSARTRAVKEAEKKLDRELKQRVQEVQRRAREEQRAKERAEKKRVAAEKAEAKARAKAEKEARAAAGKKPDPKKDTSDLDALAARIAAKKAEEAAAPKSPLSALGGKRIVHEADGRTFTLDYLPSPDDPRTALVTGLASSGKGSSADAQAGVLAAKLREAGFTKVDFNRADNEDGRAPARERLFAPIVKALNEKLAEPEKKALPVPRRERVKREELKDPHVRRELERMAATAGWETEGGKALLPGDARNERGDRGTTKWIGKDPWFKEIPPELKMNEADARRAIESALKDYPLGSKQRAFVEWAIDRAEGVLYQGATGDERAEARRAYDDMDARPAKTPEPPDEDVPFALPLKPRRTPQQEAVDDFVRAHASKDVPAARLRAILDGTGRWKSGSEGALVRLFLEQEQMMKDAMHAMLPEYQPQPSERRAAFVAERKAAKGWLDTFQAALRNGATQDEAARAAGALHPEALRPARFLGGLGDAQFALGGKSRGGDGLKEFLNRFGHEDAHYAVSSKGKKTNQFRAAAEEFWEKETRTKTQMQRAAREMLGTAAGKAEVDAAIRGERQGDWREQSDLTVAAEMRVNSLLRAAGQGTTSAKKAIDLAVDYYLLRSEQGRALSAVERPREPRESFYQEAARPSENNAKRLSKLQRQLKESAGDVERQRILEEIERIKVEEARLLEEGMLALKKVGIDPETMPNTSVMAAHALRILNIARNKGVADMVVEFRASSLISHPGSSIAALAGNVLNVGWNTVLRRIAEIPVEGGASLGELRAMRAALPGAWNKALRAFWDVWVHDTPTYEAQLQDLGLITSAQSFENAKLASIPGKAGRVVRGMGLTPMTSVDEFARALGTELEAVAIAYRRAGGDRGRMAELLQSPETWEEAVRQTRRNVFQERGEASPLVELGFKARESLDQLGGGLFPVGHFTFPFVQTGVNGLLEGWRKLPGPAQAIALRNKVKGEWRTNPELRARDLAANNLSLILATSGYMLAGMLDEEGRPYVTGTTPDGNDPPMSWQMGDGQWRSYSKLMPFSSVLATIVDGTRAGGDFIEIAHSLLRQGVDSTYFDTMAGLLNAIKMRGEPDAKLARAASDFATSFVPNIVRGAAGAMDETRNVDPLRRHEGDRFGVAESVWQKLATGSAADRIDNFGRPIEKGGTFLERYLSPTAPNLNAGDEHAADKVIRAWNAALPEGEKKIVLGRAPYWYQSRGETKYMSDAQYAAFTQRAGELASSLLDESTLDPKNPTKAQVERIKRVLSRARSRARREVLRNIPLDDNEDE